MFKYSFFFSILFLLSSCSSSNTSDQSSSTTNPESTEANQHTSTNSNDTKAEPDDTDGLIEIHFTELWIWDYLDEDGEWQEMWVYREPKLNYWLFERASSFGMTNEMCEWVVVKPNGEYVMSYQQHQIDAPNTLMSQVIDFDNERDFPDFWKPTGQTKTFGDPKQGWDSFKGERYEVFFKGQPDPSEFYLGTGDIDMQGLYYFNNLDGDIKLPITFPLGIPKNTLILSEETTFEYYDMKVNYRFNSISPNSYYVYLPEE